MESKRDETMKALAHPESQRCAMRCLFSPIEIRRLLSTHPEEWGKGNK
jgi:hypothetical protein